jgi:hypothetical protein
MQLWGVGAVGRMDGVLVRGEDRGACSGARRCLLQLVGELAAALQLDLDSDRLAASLDTLGMHHEVH